MSGATQRCGTIAELDDPAPAADDAGPTREELACYLQGWSDCMARTQAIITHAATVTHPGVARRVLFETSTSTEEAVGLLDALLAVGGVAAAPEQTEGVAHG